MPLSPLEQSCDYTVIIDINTVRRRVLGKSRHRHDRTGNCNDKAGTGRNIYFPDIDLKPGRSSEFLRIIRQGILCFCHTYREVCHTQIRNSFQFPLRCRRIGNSIGTINFFLQQSRSFLSVQDHHCRVYGNGFLSFSSVSRILFARAIPPSPPFSHTFLPEQIHSHALLQNCST